MGTAPELTQSSIHLIACDQAIRAVVEQASQTIGHTMIEHATLDDFLQQPSNRPCCILTTLTEHSAAQQQQLSRVRQPLPAMIFVATSADLKLAVQVMENGALTVLQPPLEPAILQFYMLRAFQRDAENLRMLRQVADIDEKLQLLSGRQREVLDCVISGMPTKSIAHQMNVSKRLVEKERSFILKLFNVPSTPDVTLKMGEFRVLDRLRSRFDPANQSGVRDPASRSRLVEVDSMLHTEKPSRPA